VPGKCRSLADPYFDPFWARVNESGITVAFHGGDSGYGRYFADWGEGGDVESFKGSAWKATVAGNRAPFDAMAALVLPRPVPPLPPHPRLLDRDGLELGALAGAEPEARVRHQPEGLPRRPGGDLRRHVWISPFHEDDVKLLKDLLGADRLVMGSDWPHAEGLRDPTDYVRELAAFTPAEQKLVMHDNAQILSRRLS